MSVGRSPAKIVFLNGSAQPGGGEIALAELVSAVPGADLILFDRGPAEELFRSKGLAVGFHTLPRAVLVDAKESGFPGLRMVFQVVSHAWRLSRILRRYDLVHCNNQKAWVVGAISSRIARRPVVWHLHDILSREHFSAAKIRLVVALSRWRRALVLANSEASARAFVLAGGREDRVEVLHNPVDPRPFREALHIAGLRQELSCGPDEPIWGLFSRLASWKGQHVAIDALSELPRGHLLLVGAPLFGEEPWERELRARVERLGLRKRVHFLGFRSDVPALLASIDGAIHASTVAEPFGLVILEAQLAGVPVVATAAGGALEIVEPGRTGWLVPPGDPSALASVLREWSERPEESRALGRAASEHAAATFDARRLRRRFLEILEREAAR